MKTIISFIGFILATSCAEQQAPVPPSSSISSQSSSNSSGKNNSSAPGNKLPKPSDIEFDKSQSQTTTLESSYEFGAKVGSDNTRKLVSECVNKKGYYDRKSAKCEASKALTDILSKKVINCSQWSELEKLDALEKDGVAKIRESLNGMNYLPDQCYDFGSYFYLYLAYQEDAKSPIQIRKFCVNNSSGCP